jgi:hypothetical protein
MNARVSEICVSLNDSVIEGQLLMVLEEGDYVSPEEESDQE